MMVACVQVKEELVHVRKAGGNKKLTSVIYLLQRHWLQGAFFFLPTPKAQCVHIGTVTTRGGGSGV
jgi:hypothetical protein